LSTSDLERIIITGDIIYISTHWDRVNVKLSDIKISYYPFINLQKSYWIHCADLTMILKINDLSNSI